MYCIGLTGTIASGKSTVTSYFAQQGIEVINADQIAKSLTDKEQPALEKITRHFGNGILMANGELDRRALRNLIFTHPQERIWLEELLHPLIRAQIKLRIKQCQGPYCIIEIPLLSNKTDYPYLDRVLLVLSNEKTQVARLIARDNCSKEQALAILAQQPNESQNRSLADDIILNNGSAAALQKKILKLHKIYLNKANI